MATIYRNIKPILTRADAREVANFTESYWGSAEEERAFLLPLWQADRMFQASTSDQIALRVTNLADKNLVDAKWIVFEEAIADSLRDPVETGIHYYVIEDQYYFGPVLTNNPVGQSNGFREITRRPHNAALVGRIGKDSTTDEIFVFIQVVECRPINPGTGGPGSPLAGVKIPVGGSST